MCPVDLLPHGPGDLQEGKVRYEKRHHGFLVDGLRQPRGVWLVRDGQKGFIFLLFFFP